MNFLERQICGLRDNAAKEEAASQCLTKDF